MGLSLQKVDKIVGEETHLLDINLDLKPGSRNVILGHTLSGKTSLLRIMAGLDRPTRGRIIVDGTDVTGRSVRKRSVAMVYQQFINYPSLTVFNNIASPLKIAGRSKSEIAEKVHKIAKILHLEDYLDRLPAELSGGQQQRTAIARALVKDARLLLLDEPLINLDYKLREELREELQGIFQEREAIVVYTTTEPTEALMLGGNIVVMDEGRVIQSGPTPGVYHSPATSRVAEVFSDPPINFLPGRVQNGAAELGEGLRVPLYGHLKSLSEGEYSLGLRANHLSLKGNDTDAEIKGVVELSEINGSETFVHVRHGDSTLVVQEDGIYNRRIGAAISVYMNPEYLFVFNPDGTLAASPAGGRQ